MTDGILVGLVLAGFATSHFNRDTYDGPGAYLKIASMWVALISLCALLGRLIAP